MLPGNNNHKQQLISFAQEQSKTLSSSELKQKLSDLISAYESLSDQHLIEFSDSFSLPEHLEQYEIKIIRYALQLTGGNQRAAARLLGLNYTTLNNKVKRYELGGKTFN